MEIITSNKGGLKLCLDGYMYTKHQTKASSIIWKCAQKAAHSCKSTLKTGLNVSLSQFLR